MGSELLFKVSQGEKGVAGVEAFNDGLWPAPLAWCVPLVDATFHATGVVILVALLHIVHAGTRGIMSAFAMMSCGRITRW